ncbi:hypothetical protein BIW11_05616, partial [Tropilaelaps mercedesae]
MSTLSSAVLKQSRSQVRYTPNQSQTKSIPASFVRQGRLFWCPYVCPRDFGLQASAAKGISTTGEELDSPHGPHGADMAELYAGSLILHEPGSASMESLDSGSQALEELIGRDLDDPGLRLLDDEPAQWSATVDKKIVKKLKERDVKRQEAIYELILTEKHHCVTLKIMEKIYMDGMCNELQLQPEAVNRMFPRLAELLSFHCTFLHLLRTKQAQANPDNQTIDSIGDVLLQM